MMSVQLICIGVMALLLIWRGRAKNRWRQFYWATLAGLFIFLGIDEFYSLHETFNYWRQTYMLLGGGIIAASAVIAWYSSNRKEQKFIALFILGFGLMGFGGVFLDAFSNMATVGPISFTCSTGGFWGVSCQRYGMLEEFYELLGGGMMLLSVAAMMTAQIDVPQQRLPRQLVAFAGASWLLGIIGGYWLLPTVQSQLFASPMRADYLDGRLSLVRGNISHDVITIGETLDVTLYLRANEFLPKDYSMSVTLLSRNPNNVGQISHDDMELGDFEYPTYAWIPGLLVRNTFHLTIPQDAPTEVSYRLVVSIWNNHYNNRVPVESHEGFIIFDDGRLIIADIPVLADAPASLPPTASDFRFEGQFRLAGYELAREMTVGDTVDIRFWWSTQAEVDTYWWHFLHFVHTERDLFYSFNQEPFEGQFPTGTWPASMTIVDTWPIRLPDDMVPGLYRVQTGMFNLETSVRASVLDEDGQPVPEQSIILGTVEVHAP
jgi:hypothetical protein